MTEKRFTFHHDVDGIDYIQDETNGFCFICDKLLCSLLNELNDENDQLKQQLTTKYIVNKQYEKLQRLKKENERLKLKNELLEQDLYYCAHQFEEDVKNILLDLKGGLND